MQSCRKCCVPAHLASWIIALCTLILYSIDLLTSAGFELFKQQDQKKKQAGASVYFGHISSQTFVISAKIVVFCSQYHNYSESLRIGPK